MRDVFNRGADRVDIGRAAEMSVIALDTAAAPSLQRRQAEPWASRTRSGWRLASHR